MNHWHSRVIGRYFVCHPIGSGGMATVHLARLMGEVGFTRVVAAKQLHPLYAQDPEFAASFVAEAQLLSRIRHPNVVVPLEVVNSVDGLTILMEYVHGESLSNLFQAAGGPVPAPIAVGVLAHALLGLHAAHEATDLRGAPLQVVHRDVSPQNILVGVDGIARVVDFGSAKARLRRRVTRSGQLMGKLGYLSPEQLQLRDVDRRADIFASGIVLWELLVGQRLFASDVPTAASERALADPVRPPSALNPEMPADLDTIVLKALAPCPAQRFTTAREMAGALMQALQPATPLEVGAWVEDLAGSAIARREQLIFDLERLSIDELTVPIQPEHKRQSGGFHHHKTVFPVGNRLRSPAFGPGDTADAAGLHDISGQDMKPTVAGIRRSAGFRIGSRLAWGLVAIGVALGAERLLLRSVPPSLVHSAVSKVETESGVQNSLSESAPPTKPTDDTSRHCVNATDRPVTDGPAASAIGPPLSGSSVGIPPSQHQPAITHPGSRARFPNQGRRSRQSTERNAPPSEAQVVPHDPRTDF